MSVELIRTPFAVVWLRSEGPVDTPRGDSTVRLRDPDGMQITLYQVPDKS